MIIKQIYFNFYEQNKISKMKILDLLDFQNILLQNVNNAVDCCDLNAKVVSLSGQKIHLFEQLNNYGRYQQDIY